MTKVELKAVKKVFGDHTIIPKLDLSIETGEFLVLVGPSGCGKSTILRMVAGLEEASEGQILIDGKVVNDISPKARGVAMVFQNYALYPHMTVRENLGFSLKMSKIKPAEIETRVKDVAGILGLHELLDRKPSQMSGGQKQRVAMGRAMVRQPKVLLFDEPLSNLDAQLRIKMRSEIAHLHKKARSTVVYVTHDQTEAMTLADRIAVVNHGQLEQVGPPLEVYHNPKTRFVAGFIGTPPMNFLPASAFASQNLPHATDSVGFRPENTQLLAKGPDGAISAGKGKVSLVEPLGLTSHIHVQLGANSVVCETRTAQAPKVDEEIGVWLNAQELFFFNKEGARLS